VFVSPEGNGHLLSVTRTCSRRMGQSTVSIRRRSNILEPDVSLPTVSANATAFGSFASASPLTLPISTLAQMRTGAA
jgi:hypothetical protein